MSLEEAHLRSNRRASRRGSTPYAKLVGASRRRYGIWQSARSSASAPPPSSPLRRVSRQGSPGPPPAPSTSSGAGRRGAGRPLVSRAAPAAWGLPATPATALRAALAYGLACATSSGNSSTPTASSAVIQPVFSSLDGNTGVLKGNGSTSVFRAPQVGESHRRTPSAGEASIPSNSTPLRPPWASTSDRVQ